MLVQLVHEASFRQTAMQVFTLPVEQSKALYYQFLPLMHIVTGLGYLFDTSFHTTFGCNVALREG